MPVKKNAKKINTVTRASDNAVYNNQQLLNDKIKEKKIRCEHNHGTDLEPLYIQFNGLDFFKNNKKNSFKDNHLMLQKMLLVNYVPLY